MEYELQQNYVKATKGTRLGECKTPGVDSAVFVSYFPTPWCGEKKVYITGIKMAVCFYEQGLDPYGYFKDCHAEDMRKCEFRGSKRMLKNADRF